VKQNCGQIIVLDLASSKQEVFAQNRSSLPAGKSLSGFNFPIDVKFGPDGSMYVVDFGVFDSSKQTTNAVAKTGVIWKISKQRSEYQNFKSDCMSKLKCEQDDQWNPDYTALGQKLQEFIGTLGQEWGIYLKDLTSGKTLGVNEDLQVPAASTVKVPVVLYASHLVTRGELSWNERLTYYSARDWRGGAGTLQYTAKDGDSFTIRELAEKAITISDNVAWKMLEKRLGIENIIAFMRQLGGTVVYPGGQNISTPRDNAIYMEAALEFSKVSPEGEKLMFDLANTIWNTGLNRNITEVTVAHKEGDIMGVADDVGVIYAYRPYILSIMSKGHDDVELGFEKIGQISRMVFDYQVSLFNK
jgi:beta-lactamase class A